jgi:hypothetical protein
MAEIQEFRKIPIGKSIDISGFNISRILKIGDPRISGTKVLKLRKRWKAQKRIAVQDIGIREFGVCVDMRFLASRVSNSRYTKTC